MSLPRRPFVTNRTHLVFGHAFDLAERLGHDDVTPVHVALGLIREPGIAAEIISQRVQLEALEAELEAHLPPERSPRVPARAASWTPGIERVLQRAVAESTDLGVEYQGAEHLLLALLRDESGAPAQILARHGLRHGDVRSQLQQLQGVKDDN